MAKKKILFVCFDDEYLSAIEYKFTELVRDNADISFISDKNILRLCGSGFDGKDIIILPAEISEVYKADQISGHVYYLTDKTADCKTNRHIYKYDSVKTIADKILPNFVGENNNVGKTGTKMIGVFSAAGGTGNTIISMLTAYNLKRAGNRVLYISTVPHQDFSYYIEKNTYLGTEFCYQCAINIKNAIKIIDNEIQKGEFDYLRAFANLPVSYKVNFGVYMQLAAYIKKRNIYDYIVVELSPELYEDKLIFLSECDKRLFITTQDRIAVKKLENFLTGIAKCDDKPTLICNRYINTKPDYLIESKALEYCDLSQYIAEFDGQLDWNTAKNYIDIDKTVMCIR